MVLQMNCDIKKNQAGTALAFSLDEFLLAMKGSHNLPHPAHVWLALTRYSSSQV